MDYTSPIINRADHLSFLKVRDPSILTANRPKARENVKTALKLESTEERCAELGDNIKIYLRIKKAENIPNIYKINQNEIECCIPANSTCSKNVKDVETVTKTYQFSHIFDINSTQEEIFNCAVKPKVLKFINGVNSTLMSYGASGSGKTFTMAGTIAKPGIIPRTLVYLFKTLPELPEIPSLKPAQSGEVEVLNEICSQQEVDIRKGLLKLATITIGEQHTNTYEKIQERLSTESAGRLDDLSDVILGVWVSFAEIYNEYIYDLLTSKSNLKATARLKLQLGAFNENTYIKNLTNVSVSSGIEAYQILQYGLHNLNYASTTINMHSSRSHCIFTIKIVQMIQGMNVTRLNYFNFCDLAGSERLKKTLNVGDRLKESNNINTSLLVLGRCFSCIRESQKRNVHKLVPFRESKLTRLFQKALSGYETISMIVNLNPSFDMLEENQHVLNFSAIAKEVSVKLVPIIPKKKNRFSVYLAAKTTKHNKQTNLPGSSSDESEVSELKDFIDEMHNKLVGLTKYTDEQERNIRKEVTRQYSVIIKDLKEYQQKVLKCQEAKHKEEFGKLKVRYESEHRKDEIIILDSSSDEGEDYNQEKPINSELEEFKKQLFELKSELTQKDQIINELRKTIEDADSYRCEIQITCEEKINGLMNESMVLIEKSSELNTLIEEYRKIIETTQDEFLL